MIENKKSFVYDHLSDSSSETKFKKYIQVIKY